MRALGVLLLLAATAAAADPSTAIDKAFASRIAAIGERALKEEQEATARRILERAIELDPDQPIARARLGYKRTFRGWTAAAPAFGADRSGGAAARFLLELREEEDRRAQTYVRAGLADHYPVLLARLPRNEELHKALGHEKVGSRYARPELAAAAKRYDAQRARWRELAAPVSLGEHAPVQIPGCGERPGHRVEERCVSGTLPPEEIVRAARTTHAAHAFLRELFGESVRTWDRPLVVFLAPANYSVCVRAACAPGPERDRWLRCGLMQEGEMAAFMAGDSEYAIDTYAHAVGIYSAAIWCVPENDEDRRSYAWFREGLGYSAALALFGTGITWYRGDESSTKIPPTVPPPHGRSRAELLGWLQSQVLDGTIEPLRGVCGRTLNSLDLLMSLEAWSFVEFLAAYDPEALRDLPAALLAQEEGSFADRSNRALEACFGKGFAELEPLWRTFVLEIM